MKKLLFIIIGLTCLISNVSASGVVKLVSVTNKCSVVSDNVVTIPVNVFSRTDGILTSVVDKYTLGMIDNKQDSMIVNISDIEGDNISSLVIDTKRDSNNQSYIYYSIIDDMNLNKLDKLMSFNIQIEFTQEIPDSYDVLGTKVTLGDEEICELVNGHKVDIIESVIYKELNKDKENLYKIMFYIMLGTFVIGLILVIIMLIKRNK